MRVKISEAVIMLLTGIIGITVFAYLWERLIDLVFKKFGEWWYNGKE